MISLLFHTFLKTICEKHKLKFIEWIHQLRLHLNILSIGKIARRSSAGHAFEKCLTHQSLNLPDREGRSPCSQWWSFLFSLCLEVRTLLAIGRPFTRNLNSSLGVSLRSPWLWSKSALKSLDVGQFLIVLTKPYMNK